MGSLSTYLAFALIGLGAGAVYAGLGAGLVVAYRGTGVINFAQGAMAMWGAYVYSELRASGDLVLPVVGVPARLHLGGDVPLAAAMVAGVLSAALLGLAAHLLVFRRLRTAPALAKVVASVGVMLTLQAIATLRFGSQQRVVSAFLPNDGVQVAGISVPRDRFYLAGIAALTALVLWAYFRYSRLGLATRAAAENEIAASLTGFSPDVLASAAWALSGALAGLFGILIAPVTGLNTVGYTLFVVPALAVAVVGRLQSFGVTCLAGLTLGMVQAEIVYLQTKAWYPRWAVTGATDAVPFLVVIVALLLLGKSLPTRGAAGEARLPEVARPRRLVAPALTLSAGGAILLIALDGSYRFGLIQSLILAILMLSFVVITGFVGQISLAQAAFAGTAGFVLSKLAAGAAVPFPISTMLAAASATALGVVVGIPALRIRGVQLAVVTLAAAVAIQRFVFDNPSITSLSGNLIPNPRLFGLDLGIRSGQEFVRLTFGFLTLAVLAITALAVVSIGRSATGRRFLAVRSNERAAASVGVNVATTKLLAFAISSFIAGLGGAMLGYSRGQLSAASFDIFSGLQFLVFAYLGGIASIAGALIAGMIAPLGIAFVVLNRAVELGQYYLLVSGVSVIVIALFNPEGIAGTMRTRGARVVVSLLRGRTRGRPAPPPARETVAADRRDQSLAATPLPRAVGAHMADEPRGPLLATESLVVSYGGHRAIDGVSLQVEHGLIVGLIGPNGAGKTTFIDALTGFVPYTGHVHFDGAVIDALPPHSRARRGLIRTWQSLELFGDLTVAESLRVAAERPTATSVLVDLVHPQRSHKGEGEAWALELLGLRHLADRRPHELSLGQRKLAGLARAIAARPTLLLLDEPGAGLGPEESATLAEHLRIVADHGVTILLVDHDMHLVLGSCDYVYVLDFGRLIAEGAPGEIQKDERVIAAYLGSEVHTSGQIEQPHDPLTLKGRT